MNWNPQRKDDQGAVAIMVAVLASVLFVLAALVVDLGLARDTKRQSQNAADASALAAANALYPNTHTPAFDSAIDAAKAFALANFDVQESDWEDPTLCPAPDPTRYVPPGETGCISFENSTKPTNVRVVIPTHSVNTGLGALAGVEEIEIQTQARAALQPPGLPCIVCVLGSGQTHDLQNGDVFVDGGNVHFNGNVSVGSNGFVVTNGTITVEGTASPNPTTNFTPDATTAQPAIADPLAYVTLPPDMTMLHPQDDPCADGPGIYGSFNFPNSLCTLSPGLYVIAGDSGTEWKQAGNASSIIAGSGVTLYFTCGSGTPVSPTPCTGPEAGATLNAAGNGSIAISPPTSGPLKGVAIAYDRQNNATMLLTGKGIAGMSGAIYAAAAKLQMNGNGCTETNSAIVVNSIEMNGSPACLKVAADPAGGPEPPPTDIYLDE